jgi:hypothetical protein
MIEDIIKAHTAELALHRAAIIENTAALREILSVGASTAAVQAVPEPVKKSRAKAAPLTVVEPEPTPEPEPAKEETLKESVEKFHKEVNDAPEPECPAPDAEEPEPEAPEAPVVPNLPPTELRAKLKEEIKLRIMGDPGFKNHFEATREKYGIALVKDLTDDQLPGFYAEVLAV